VKYAFIHATRSSYSVVTLCNTLQVSRRSYYDWVNYPPSKRTVENIQLLEKIGQLFIENREVYGAPRIHKELLSQGYVCSKNRVAKIMRQAKIVPKTIKKFRITTDSRKSKKPAKNIMNQNFTSANCNEKWVADVTYIPTREGWLFLAAVLDLFSRRIVGWSMGEKLNSELSIRALQDALNRRGNVTGLIHHSDQGKEYYASQYQKILKQNKIICSMSRKGNCYDNAAMESFFHSLKTEQVHHDDYKTRQQARAAIFDYIELFYNRKRKHSSIDYVSPIEHEEKHV